MYSIALSYRDHNYFVLYVWMIGLDDNDRYMPLGTWNGPLDSVVYIFILISNFFFPFRYSRFFTLTITIYFNYHYFFPFVN